MLEVEHITPILNVCSVPKSIAWFEQLGWKRSFTWNAGGTIIDAADCDEDGDADYGGVCCGRVEIFLCQDAQGARDAINAFDPSRTDDETAGVWMTWWLETPAEVDELYTLAKSLSYSIIMPLTIQPWNAIEFRLRHPEGHTFRVSAFL